MSDTTSGAVTGLGDAYCESGEQESLLGAKRVDSIGDAAARPKPQPRHEDIINAAAQLFHEKGFAATTTQDIAERVGMLKGSLYYYIESKEALLAEVIERAHRVFTDSLDMIAYLDGTPVDRLWAYVYRFALANTANNVESAVFFSEFRSLKPDARDAIIAMRDANDHLVRGFITAGQESGLMRAEVDPKLTATAILTMCTSITRWYQPGGEWKPEFIARSFADLAVSQVVAHGADGGAETVDVNGIVERLHALSVVPPSGSRPAG